MSFYFSAGPSSPSTNPSPNASGAPSRRRLSRSSPYSVPVRGVGVATEESEDGTVGSFVPLNSSLNANSVESDDEMAESASVAGSVSDSVITQSSRASEPAAEERRMEQRQKQIDYGKNTIGYERYTSVIRKEQRQKHDAVTPDKNLQCSKRCWDGLVRVWRRKLHVYDPFGSTGEKPVPTSEDADVFGGPSAAHKPMATLSSIPQSTTTPGPTPTLNFTKPAATPTRSNAPPSENVVKPVLSFPATSQSRSAPTTPEKSRWDMMAGLEHLTPAARRLYEQNKYAMSSKSKLSVSTFSEEVNYTSGSDNAQQ